LFYQGFVVPSEYNNDIAVTLKLVIVLFLLSIAGLSFAAPLPGGITPGGAMPQISNQPEPFVYPTINKPGIPTTSPLSDEDPKAPRMLLKGFEIYGVTDHPDRDITLDKVRQLIADETKSMIPEGNQRLFTIAMFENIAQAITRYYRQRGYFLARAYIPEQKVKNGIVKLKVVESFLDQVVFDGNTLYDDETMSILFEDLIDQPVYITDVEDALYKLNDYPGLTASAVFGPGTEPGSAAIVMRTEEVSSYNLISVDNYGSAFTGENRVLYRHTSNNLFGQADLLAFNLMTSFSPANNQYADVLYVQPVFRSLFKVGGGLRYNIFTVGEELEDLDINGESIILNGFIDYKVLHTKLDQFSLITDLSYKIATSKVVDTVAAEDKLTVIRLDAIYSGVDRWLWVASHEASASFTFGTSDVLSTQDAAGNVVTGRGEGGFSKINLAYSRLQPTFDLQSLLFRFQTQISSDLLSSLEKYSLGGPYNVRAYPVAEILVDKAFFTSFEYILTASPEVRQTWLNNLQLSVFYDYATGELNDPLINELASTTLSGFGIGVQVEPFNMFRVRLDLASATGDEPSDLQTLPFYLSMEYRF
jgi:hemolysin activation/secretion protein